MPETPGLDAIDAGFRAEMGPPVEELNALNVAPERMPVKDLLWSVGFLRAERERLRTERNTAVATVAELHQRLTRREREHNADRAEMIRLRDAETERDTYRTALVALLRKVSEDQVPAYYEELVPADVRAEALAWLTEHATTTGEGK